MLKRILTVAAIALAIAPAASAHGRAHAATASCGAAPVQTFTVYDQAGVRPVVLDRIENALTAQSLQLRDWYGTPCAEFAAGGWPVYLQSEKKGWTPGGEHYAAGYVDNTPCGQDLPTPCLLIGVNWGSGPWSVGWSHEMLESLVDPTNLGNEVCDPVSVISAGPNGLGFADTYQVDDVAVSDFVSPDWFSGGPSPYDWTRAVHRPGQTAS